MPPIIPLYHCTQQQLYTIAKAAWASCLIRIAAFGALKAKYVALFVTGKVAAINAAQALPDEEQRKQIPVLLREQLSVLAESCRDFWQRLKLYIIEAFPENEIEIQLNGAGQTHYEKASSDNWDAVQRLMIDGSDFIDTNSVALLAGLNMPVGFEVEFNAAKDEFDTLYATTNTAALDEEVNTQTKINANNAIYEDLMTMCKDGQRIFKNDEAVSNLFTFEKLLIDIAGPGVTGLKGLVKNSVTNLPIGEPGATITFVGTGIDTITDGDGKFQKVIAEGTYDLHVTCVGFVPQTILAVEVSAGIMRTKNITLVPLP